MNKNIIIKSLLTLAVVVASVISSQLTFAAGIGFAVEPIFNGNQIDTDKEFYYLLTKPGEEQTIEFDIKSTQKKPIKVKITPQNAWTQSNGQMGYSDDLELVDESLKNPMTSLIEMKNDVISVANFETKKVSVKIISPKDHYSGIKAGALTFSVFQDGKKEAKGVATDYGVRIGMMTSESGDAYNDSKELLLNSVKPTVINSHKLVVGRLQNPDPKMLVGLNLVGEITDKKTGKVIKVKKMDNVVLAPNSHFDYEFDWGIEPMPAGDFTMLIKGENGVDSWRLTKDFSISGDRAKKINDESAFKIVTATWIKILAIILGAITLVNSVYIFVRMNKRMKLWEKMKIKRKKRKKRK